MLVNKETDEILTIPSEAYVSII